MNARTHIAKWRSSDFAIVKHSIMDTECIKVQILKLIMIYESRVYFSLFKKKIGFMEAIK